jgi:septal ring factor EnvC (AmiA/AmiB activator)
MPRGQATVPAKPEPGRIRRPNPKIRQQLTTVIDTLEPHAAAFGVVGGGMVALALATRELTDVVDEGFAVIEQRLDHIDQRLDRVEQRLDRVEQRLDRIEEKIDRYEGRFVVLEDGMRRIEAQIERLATYVMRDEAEPPKRKPPRQR